MRRWIASLMTLLLMASGCSYLASRSRAPGPRLTDAGILFSYYDPSANQVQLAGNWPENNWARGDGSVGELNIGLMADDNGDGVWEITVPLEAGRYCYLFWVNENTWHLDPGNPQQEPGGPQRKCSELVVFQRADQLEIR